MVFGSCEAFGDFVFVNNLATHHGQKFFLNGNESLRSGGVEDSACSLAITYLFEMGSDSLFHYLKSVFAILKVQLWQIRDRSYRAQYGVILNVG